MAGAYSNAVRYALAGVLNLLLRLALPLAIVLGLALAAGVISYALNREAWHLNWDERRRMLLRAVGYAGVGLLLVVGWSALRQTLPMERQAIAWRESAEATANPAPDAAPVRQFGPVAAALAERTFTRTLTLPPYMVERIGSEGVGVLAPYLSDPSAENVLRLVDTFRLSGRDVVFTRAVTRLEEQPIPFDRSDIRASFRRLQGRAYDLAFEARYSFRNAGPATGTVRFLLPLPDEGTVRDLSVTVGARR